jgi:hypothetical protein
MRVMLDKRVAPVYKYSSLLFLLFSRNPAKAGRFSRARY